VFLRDRVLLALTAGLALTTGLFLADVFVYPFGLVVLILLILARILDLKGRR